MAYSKEHCRAVALWQSQGSLGISEHTLDWIAAEDPALAKCIREQRQIAADHDARRQAAAVPPQSKSRRDAPSARRSPWTEETLVDWIRLTGDVIKTTDKVAARELLFTFAREHPDTSTTVLPLIPVILAMRSMNERNRERSHSIAALEQRMAKLKSD